MSLSDRPYWGPRSNMPPANGPTAGEMLWFLIAVNVFVFFFSEALNPLLALDCSGGVAMIYQVVTAGFCHSTFGHLLFNLWGLYLFGKLVTPYLKGREFLWLYLAGVLAGNLLFLAFNFGHNTGLLGASGAVCAVMVAAAMLEPDRRFVLIFVPFAPLRTTTLVICYTVLEILMELGGVGGQVAHLAHLGGFVGGYLYLRILLKGRTPWDPFRQLRKPVNFTVHSAPHGAGASGDPAQKGGRVSPAELDALLDKISRFGINSLSEYEMARLRQAREEMRKGN